MKTPKPHINHKTKELMSRGGRNPLVKKPASSRLLSESGSRESLNLTEMNLASTLLRDSGFSPSATGSQTMPEVVIPLANTGRSMSALISKLN